MVLAVTGDSDGMVADGETWAAAVEAHGLELVRTVSTNTGDTDFSGPATQVLDINPDLFIANNLSNESTLMIKALRERGYEGQIFATYGLSSKGNFEVGRESLDGVVFPQAFAPQSTVEAAQALSANFREATGNDADVYVAQGYNAVYFIANGLKAAESGVSADVAAGLASITRLDTVRSRRVRRDRPGTPGGRGDLPPVERRRHPVDLGALTVPWVRVSAPAGGHHR